jgi:hypothetical protein
MWKYVQVLSCWLVCFFAKNDMIAVIVSLNVKSEKSSFEMATGLFAVLIKALIAAYQFN